MFKTLPKGSPWQTCLRRQRLMWITWAGAIPAFVALSHVLGAFKGGPNPHLFIPLALVIAVPFGVSHSALVSFKCPRCDRPFFKKHLSWRINFYRRQCVHCHLPKWTESTANNAFQRTRRFLRFSGHPDLTVRSVRDAKTRT